jgi:hypothetical protein
MSRRLAILATACVVAFGLAVASPLVVFERDEVSSVAGSLLPVEASETAAAGLQGPL